MKKNNAWNIRRLVLWVVHPIDPASQRIILKIVRFLVVQSNSLFLPRTFSSQKIQSIQIGLWKQEKFFFAQNQSFQTMKTECFAKSHFQLCFTVLWFCTFAKNAVELLVHFGQRDNFWSHREYFITRLVKSTKRKWVVTLYSIMYMICTFIFWR